MTTDVTSPPPAGARWRRRLVRLGVPALLSLVLAEASLQVVFRVREAQWPLLRTSPPLFRPHPWLVGAPAPGVSVVKKGIVVSHNALGLRGPEVGPKRAGARRLVTIGGSSTYCVKVSDGDAWPLLLGQTLGADWEVVNAGAPGYGSAEHVIQTALGIADLQPDVCLYYLGWNDARNAHIAGLKGDYSDFHGPSQVTNLELTEPVGLVARVGLLRAFYKLFIRSSQNLAFDTPRPVAAEGALTSATDTRALALFERNVRQIIASCRLQGFECLFVPQRLNRAALTGDKPYGWLPYVRDVDLPPLIDAYNATLARVCAETGVTLLGGPAGDDFVAEDFVDVGHFSAQGNRKFAGLVAGWLRAAR